MSPLFWLGVTFIVLGVAVAAYVLLTEKEDEDDVLTLANQPSHVRVFSVGSTSRRTDGKQDRA